MEHPAAKRMHPPRTLSDLYDARKPRYRHLQRTTERRVSALRARAGRLHGLRHSLAGRRHFGEISVKILTMVPQHSQHDSQGPSQTNRWVSAERRRSRPLSLQDPEGRRVRIGRGTPGGAAEGGRWSQWLDNETRGFQHRPAVKFRALEPVLSASRCKEEVRVRPGSDRS